MPKPKSFLGVFTERGPLIALATMRCWSASSHRHRRSFSISADRPGRRHSHNPRGGGGWFGGDLFAPFQQQAPRRVIREDFSKAPPPEKRETVPERNVLVLGDGMADWLAYGLEEAYVEQPDMGVIRKHKTVSGLIRYQPKGDPADWAAAAKGILATEKPDAIVVMLGLNDRVAMREPAADKSEQAGRQEGRQERRARQTGRQAGGRQTRRQARWRNRRRHQARGQSRRYRIVAGRCRRQRRAAGHRAGEEHALAERRL